MVIAAAAASSVAAEPPKVEQVIIAFKTHFDIGYTDMAANVVRRSTEVPPLFWWEGPDGSRLLTMYTVKSVQPVDLRGRPSGSPIKVQDGKFVLPLRAFAPASVVIK